MIFFNLKSHVALGTVFTLIKLILGLLFLALQLNGGKLIQWESFHLYIMSVFFLFRFKVCLLNELS